MIFLQAVDSQLPCYKVPAAVVGVTLGGRVTNTVNSGWVDKGEARCRYYLRVPGADTASRVYILYIQPAADYEGLKESAPEPTRDVPDLGEAAYVYVDPETKRFWVTAVERTLISVTVSGPDLPSARKLAALALTRYR